MARKFKFIATEALAHWLHHHFDPLVAKIAVKVEERIHEIYLGEIVVKTWHHLWIDLVAKIYVKVEGG